MNQKPSLRGESEECWESGELGRQEPEDLEEPEERTSDLPAGNTQSEQRPVQMGARKAQPEHSE